MIVTVYSVLVKPQTEVWRSGFHILRRIWRSWIDPWHDKNEKRDSQGWMRGSFQTYGLAVLDSLGISYSWSYLYHSQTWGVRELWGLLQWPTGSMHRLQQLSTEHTFAVPQTERRQLWILYTEDPLESDLKCVKKDTFFSKYTYSQCSKYSSII